MFQVGLPNPQVGGSRALGVELTGVGCGVQRIPVGKGLQRPAVVQGVAFVLADDGDEVPAAEFHHSVGGHLVAEAFGEDFGRAPGADVGLASYRCTDLVHARQGIRHDAR
ncbi:hypothetical protein ACWEQC_22215 [Streptomyces shenzhenensis]